jgi:DNA-binding NarL/FixJ family response regulator
MEFTLGHTPPLVDPLTPRQEEVLDLLAQEGLNDKEIAERLVIQKMTVWKHLSHIYGKLGVRSRSEAIVWATRYRTAREEDT